MELSKIEEIAKLHGLEIRNTRPRLVDCGDVVKFKASNEITYAGRNIIEFAKAIEAEILKAT